jgi:hypothetical protein
VRLVGARTLFVVIGFLLRAGVTDAQAVRGTVVHRDSTSPVAGVIVAATDERGGTVVRALSGARGEFEIRFAAPGRYRLTVLRIGYRPTPGPVVDVAAGVTERVRLVFAEQPVTLSAVAVRERETCRVNADTGLVVARVWEEARKAMLTTQLVAGASLVAEWIEYDRTLDSTARIVRQQRVRTARNPTTHAFKSVPAALLAKEGYVVADGGVTTFYAPDAEVLLSEAFVNGHCFHLETPAGNLIGVGFKPSRDRREMREIQGTLWLDRQSAELKTLEFTYTNLSDVAEAAGAGGRVEFLRLGDGNWLVSRWSVRMPKLSAVERRTSIGTGNVMVSGTGTVVRAIQVTGGEVTRVFHRDSMVYETKGPRVALQVVASDSLLPAGGAQVTLDGTDYSAIADSLGRVVMSPVLPGRYVARVRTPLMDSLALPPVAREIETSEGARVDSLTLPGARDALLKSCPVDSVRNGEGMLRGRVRDEHGNAVKHAAVTVTWQRNVSLISGTTADYLNYVEQTIGGLADDAGLWRVCGAPRETLLRVSVVADSGSDLRNVRLAPGQAFTAVDLLVHRASARELAMAIGGRQYSKALVEFAVVDLGGRVVPGATLDVSTAAGLTRTIVTGPGGRALLPDVAPGLLTVRARRVGLKEGRLVVTVEAGRNTVPIMLSEVSTPALDTVRIVGDRPVIARHNEFETRRINREATVSITREEIERRNPPNLWQMLMAIPSVRVVDNDTLVAAMSSRTVVTSIQNQGACFLTIMIDGIIKSPSPGYSAYDLRMLPAPDEIHGIEVFAGASSIPPKYGGTGDGKWCGMLAFWTR